MGEPLGPYGVFRGGPCLSPVGHMGYFGGNLLGILGFGGSDMGVLGVLGVLGGVSCGPYGVAGGQKS